ncbi:putative udp-glucose:glycoprotein [Phaeomoniella chlamydospora]|uniref:Putative udp-glucose:glycoprotein n=1 Tax=Phaeomoniella chlamydospora TaxID=158046 RepID=A0A0G2HLG3_PHACM|nr:putative udp-glucose:glycoprotein [Phaeomoniella chlamydospora]
MTAAQDAACPVWVHFEGQQYCSPALERAQQPVEYAGTDQVLPFDHILGGTTEAPPSIIYADITSPLFAEFHQIVSKTAKAGQTSYRVRYRPTLDASPHDPLFLNGYGFELVLKRTDYIVIDDREASTSAPEDQVPLEKLAEHTPADIKPLSKSDVSKLGLKAASFVMSSSEPFDTLLKLTQDFPKHSAAIAAHNATDAFLTEFNTNREEFLPAGYNIMWINGLQIDARQVNAFSLLDHLRKERALINSFREEGLSAAEAVNLLSHGVIAQAQVDNVPQRYDFRDEAEGGNVIIWLNDIEKDSRYENWPSRLSSYLQRVYPGQLPTVRRNLHNLIIPVDLADTKELELVVATLYNYVKRTVPVRFGLVPSLHTPGSEAQAKIAYHLVESYGISALLKYFELCLESGKVGTSGKSSFNNAIKEKSVRTGQQALSFDAIQTSDTTDQRIKALNSYVERLALTGPTPPILINGVALPRDDSWLESMSSRVGADLRQIQRGIVEEVFQEDSWLPDFFLFQAARRRNALVVPEDSSSIQNVAISQLLQEHKAFMSSLPSVSPSPGIKGSELIYLLLVANLDTEEGRSLLVDALEFTKLHPEVELAVLQNPQSYNSCSELSLLAQTLLSEDAIAVDDIILQVRTASLDLQEGCSLSENEAAIRGVVSFLGLQPSENGLLLNQRLVSPVKKGQFIAEDFEHLLHHEKTKHFLPLTTALQDLGLDSRIHNALSMAKLNSMVALAFISDLPEGLIEGPPLIRIDKFKGWMCQDSCIHTSTSTDPSLRIIVAIDPTVELAQQWVPILKVLSELHGVDLKIYFNPRERIQELSIKRFYRQVLDSQPRFDSNGKLQRPQAVFTGIPEAVLLNLGMDVPPTWLVAPKTSTYDLDNIKLNSVAAGQNIDAVYELKNVLIEGHSRDTTTGQPPRGVQLLLGTESNPHYTDTIIMANLGYFQFKANPGIWQISLQPGPSSRIFTIDSVGSKGYRAQPGDEGTTVALLSFQGVTLYPRLSRKSGMDTEDVLESGPKPGSPMDFLSRSASFASSALSSITKSSSGSTNADINIFSVASGHLYERMLNIMILSVLKNTKSTVKFWFIEQFLSPSFKELLPHLSVHYNFSYEMVTYKWPHWLRGQKEKQREIWGYKILFLDVLFPLSLDKVIFVDADQIVRTDMLSLTQVDLHSAPYGFTPMCDSRTEMEGFRFWKQGYWKQYLQGKPYHISALYVVDLKRFRQLAAGDRLRQQYHTLSADPNSLSNLDQDLPNHMQFFLPIHSLDQDWLWCETWCSDESFSSAKTVDLCNNPMTKEPKLDRARRQVPEWTLYDDEIAEVARNIAKDLQQDSDEEGNQTPSHLKGGVQAELEGSVKEGGKKDSERKRDEL